MSNRNAAIKIIKLLSRNGFQALLAGGCVRDMLLHRPARDYDVATSAHPEDVMKLFKRTLKVGAKFGVVIVLLEDKQVEVATFRTEAGYADGRHPTTVRFATAAEDSSRRDFTINGMFYDPLEKKVIDYVDGQADLKKQIIRTIGEPSERFGEDYLRMLRAVRFSAQLGFAIEPKTWAAICHNAKYIVGISGERKCMELEDIFIDTNRCTGVSLLADSGLAEAIFPALSAEQIKLAIKVLHELPRRIDFPLALAGFFAGCDTKFALEKCQILKLSRSQTKHLKFLLTNRGKLLNKDMSLAELKMALAEPYFWDLYNLQKAIQKAAIGGNKSFEQLIVLKSRIEALGDIELKPRPLLNGHDLMRLGSVSGPRLGQLAQEMYIAQLEGKLQTTEQAEQWAKKWLESRKVVEQ